MPTTNNRSLIRAILNIDRTWSAYALGDLSPGFYEHCEWHVPDDHTNALVLVYRGLEPTILFAQGEAESVERLVEEIADLPVVFLSIRQEIVPIFSARYQECQTWRMWRMVLNPIRYQAVPTKQTMRLGPDDLEALRALYSDGDDTGESPDFFLPSMLSQGVYFGIYEGSEMIAAAGTHLVTSEEGVGAVGNVYTRRDRRGRGHALTVTSAVTNELLKMKLPAIVLNVNQQNKAAIHVYERLGYERHSVYHEGLARHPQIRQ